MLSFFDEVVQLIVKVLNDNIWKVLPDLSQFTSHLALYNFRVKLFKVLLVLFQISCFFLTLLWSNFKFNWNFTGSFPCTWNGDVLSLEPFQECIFEILLDWTWHTDVHHETAILLTVVWKSLNSAFQAFRSIRRFPVESASCRLQPRLKHIRHIFFVLGTLINNYISI